MIRALVFTLVCRAKVLSVPVINSSLESATLRLGLRLHFQQAVKVFQRRGCAGVAAVKVGLVQKFRAATQNRLFGAVRLPASCSNSESTNSLFAMIGLRSSPYSLSISSALMCVSDAAEI